MASHLNHHQERVGNVTRANRVIFAVALWLFSSGFLLEFGGTGLGAISNALTGALLILCAAFALKNPLGATATSVVSLLAAAWTGASGFFLGFSMMALWHNIFLTIPLLILSVFSLSESSGVKVP